MKIVITDGMYLNPGDLNWDCLAQYGELIIYDSTTDDELLARCREAAIIVTNKTVIRSEVIEEAEDLRLIAVTATGYNNIDLNAARAKNILVCNVPEYSTFSVAQHAFALLLELVNHVGIHAESVWKGEWAASGQWCYVKKPITELKDKVLGIIGYGKIGRRTAELGRAFGMQVIFNNRSKIESTDDVQVSLDTLFSESDVVSIHCPLTKENIGFVNESTLSRMKPSALLINTSRGALINEAHLVTALRNGVLAAAALDVLSEEPPPAGHPLTTLPNCIVTPHNAWISFEARQRLMSVTCENIRLFLAGTPANVV